MLSDLVTTLSPWRASWGSRDIDELSRREAKRLNSSTMRSKGLLAVINEIHLVHRQHDVPDPQQIGDKGVPAGLLDHAQPGVDEDDGEVRGRGAGDHVAGVLDVAGRVGDDELAFRGREVAVGHVDGDALLALGAEPVGEEREVDVFVAALLGGRSTASIWSSKVFFES
jgi:hypothetical protein